MIDEEHLWLSAEMVTNLALEKIDGWENGFNQMLDYATSKGWTENNRELIRAHIEWTRVEKWQK